MSTNYARDRQNKNQFLMPWAQPDSISTADAAAMLQCHRDTVRELVKDKVIRAYRLRPDKPKSPFRVSRRSVEAYMEMLREETATLGLRGSAGSGGARAAHRAKTDIER